MQRRDLNAVVAKNRFQSAAKMREFAFPAAGELYVEESVRGALDTGAITIPPRLGAMGHAIHVDVLQADHLEHAVARMRAAPAGGATSAVGRFGDGKGADGVVDHHRARAEAASNLLAAVCIGGPNTGSKSEG
jgi:hypothetical protein